jgi:hypothetical protein
MHGVTPFQAKKENVGLEIMPQTTLQFEIKEGTHC